MNKQTIGLWLLMVMMSSCGENASPTPAEPTDGFDANGGISMKVAGKDWKADVFKVKYDALYRVNLITGIRENPNNPDYPAINFNFMIPLDAKVNQEIKIGNKINAPRIPYIFFESSGTYTGYGFGFWDSREGESEGVFKITTNSAKEIAGTFSGKFWDINNQRITGRTIGGVEITEGKFRVLK